MSSHQYVYVGPYLKFPKAPRAPWLDDDALIRADTYNSFDVWFPNRGNYNLILDDTYGQVQEPCPISAEAATSSLHRFLVDFDSTISSLRELYSNPGVVEFGVVTYWA